MLTDPLPKTLDVRKAAARGVSVSGTVRVLDLPRFLPLLAADDALVQADFTFTRDEENRYLVQISTTGDVQVSCQRCLDPMPLRVASETQLAVVWSDEQAAHLPRHLDPLIVSEEACNLWELVEDELILAMPAFSYHEAAGCKQQTMEFSDPDAPEPAGEDKPNPFNVLEQLKPGNKHQE
tara:strand:+ start:27581 stop:28120 length:540 start_codon:yes stop_codon:yes gene_type:complete